MEKLYTSLAQVYHEMYPSLFDYKKEFKFLEKILKKHKCKEILEIGCGTGHLATYFLRSNFPYTGLDISREMLKIARKSEPKAKFIIGDMRKIKLPKKYTAVICAGRAFTYMRNNNDVMRVLKSVNIVLRKNGILIFDNFDASYIFNNFKEKMEFKARFKDRNYKRVSKNRFNLKTGFTWNVSDTYFIIKGNKKKIKKDSVILRAFTKDEINLFLSINGFKVIDQVQSDFLKEPYSFFTIAQKI